MNSALIPAILLASGLWLFAGERSSEVFTVKHRFGPKRIEFSFVFEFAPFDEPEGIGLDRILVSMPGRKQTLRIDFSACEFAPAAAREKVQFTDLTGDGYDDLLVPVYSSPMGNSGFFVFVYSPVTAEFVYCPELSNENNLESKGKGIVGTYSRDGGPNRTMNTFQWTGRRFELISTYRCGRRDGKEWESLRTRKNGKWVEESSGPVTNQ